MADFKIQVIIDPGKVPTTGRKIRDELDKIESRADRLSATLRRTFQFVGGALLIREIGQLADAFTNAQNRIRLVTDGEEQLTRVTEQLFEISNRTRASFEGTAQIYQRLAQAAQNLGVSEEEALRFTESLNKSIVISGASGAEATAGLIQFSQALASNRLSGDELRSVLEQLPFVADVIAKSLGVTRGELRKLGQDGKLTASVILSAFQEAREEIDERFGKTIPTLGQSFTVLRNNVLEFVGGVNESTGAASTLSRGIILVAENIDLLAAGVLVLAAGFLGSLVPATLTATGAMAGFSIVANNLVSLLRLNNPFTLAAAGAAAAVVITNKVVSEFIETRDLIHEINEAGAKFGLSEIDKVQVDIDRVRGNLELLNVVLERSGGTNESAAKKVEAYRSELGRLAGIQAALRAGTARDSAQAQQQQQEFKKQADSLEAFISKLNDENIALQKSSREREIANALTRESAKIQGDSQAKLSPVQKAVLEAALRLNQSYEDQARVLDRIKGPQEQLKADLIAAEKLYKSGKISAEQYKAELGRLAEDAEGIDLSGLAGPGILGNFQDMLKALQETARQEALRAQVIEDILGPLQRLTDTQRVLQEELGKGTISQEQYDAAIRKTDEDIRLLNPEYKRQADLLKELNGPLAEAKLRYQDLSFLFLSGKVSLAQYAAELAKLRPLLAPPTEMQKFLEGINGPIEEARKQQELLTQAWFDGTINLEQYKTKSAELSAVLHPLTEQEKLRADLYNQINGPQQQFIATQEQLNVLLDSGAISAQQYAVALNSAAIAANTVGSDAATGFKAGLAQIENQLRDVGGQVQNTLVNGFNNATDAIVNFAQTGELNIQDFVNQAIADLTRLALQQAFLALLPGGGAASTAANFIGPPPPPQQKAGGGAVSPGRSYLVGERGRELFTPTEAGRIAPAGETAAKMQKASSPQVNVSSPPATVNVINVSDPNEISAGIQSPEGEQAVLNVMTRQRRKVKSALG